MKPARSHFILPCVLLAALTFAIISTKKTEFNARHASAEGLLDNEMETPADDDPGAAAQFEFNMLKDKSGQIPPHIREQELDQARHIYRTQLGARSASNTYRSMGPDNLGGRTRCVAYDVRYDGNTNNILLAGGVSGGIYKSIDDGATWVRKISHSAIYTVTSLAQDPRPGHQDTWYYGTGEFLGGNDYFSAPPSGDGVYKSTDNGETWYKLPQSNTGVYEVFDRNADNIWRVLVNPSNGDVYMAADEVIYRSQNGGDTWQPVLYSSPIELNPFQSTDIVISPAGILYAAVAGYAPGTLDGIWRSETGDEGSWTRIAGEGPGGSPEGWNAEGTYGRIVLAVAPSNPDLLYALIQTLTNTCPNGTITSSRTPRLFRYNNGVWTDLTNSLPGCTLTQAPEIAFQGGYNMALAVKPDNSEVVFIGGTNLYRSTDGFRNSYVNLTQIGGYGFPLLHPDIHWMVFKPGNPSVMICANDGGMQRTSDVMQGQVEWTSLNHFYQTLQYYYVSLEPRMNSDKIIAGSQDNGSNGNIDGSGSIFQLISEGDGFSTGVSRQIDGKVYEYTSSQYGFVYRRDASWPPGTYLNITPSQSYGSGSTFVTVFTLDEDNTEFLYMAKLNRLFRNTAASTASESNWTELINASGGFINNNAAITAMATSRGAYTTSDKSLFFANGDGQAFRLDDPANCPAGSIPVEITKSIPENWGYITGIAVNPRDDDTVVITKSSYGAVGIWWTGNARAASPTWVNAERNLSLPSIRSAAIAITPSGVEYYVGTTVGLFKSTNPIEKDWTQESPTGIGNAVVSSLVLRPADNRLLAGTYGHGIWMTSLETAALPLTLLDFTGKLTNGEILLQWTTDGEIGTAGFEMQRSPDGVNYIPLGSINADGNSNVVTTYQFTDRTPGSPANYYRLKIVDKDGHFSFSKTIFVKVDGLLQQVTVVNPFSDQITIRFAKVPAGSVVAALFDMSGRLVGRKELRAGRIASVSFSAPRGILPAGHYILHIRVDGKLFVKKLMKE